VRDAVYTAITMAFPAMPSHSQSRDGRQRRTAGQITWAHEMTTKKTPYSTHSMKCSNITAKWMDAAPTESAARLPRRHGRTVAGSVRTSLPARTGVLNPEVCKDAAVQNTLLADGHPGSGAGLGGRGCERYFT
jgi:hypothetical protein